MHRMLPVALGVTSAVYLVVVVQWKWCQALDPARAWVNSPPTTCPVVPEQEIRGDSLVQVKHSWSFRSVAALDETEDPGAHGHGGGPGAAKHHHVQKELVTDDGVPIPEEHRVTVTAPPYLHIDWFTPTSINITALSASVGASKTAVVQALPKILCGLVAVICLIAVIIFLYDKRQSIALAASEVSGGKSEESTAKECEYVMIFPLAGEKRTQLHVSGTRAMYLCWDQQVPGLEYARAAFRDPNKTHILTDEELQERFSETMTQQDYNEAVTKVLREAFRGESFGLEVETFASIDHDEVFLKLRLPDDGTVEQYAMSFRYQMPLSDVVYRELDLTIPKNGQNDEVRAYTAFCSNDDDLFMNFRSVDRIRLLAARLNRLLDINSLMRQQVLAEHFAVHEVQTVAELVDEWANPKLWYRFPERKLEDKIRNYFGEEVAWLFVWQNFFMHQLLVPTAIGFVLFFRRWVLSIDAQRQVQICFGLFMSIWVTIYNRRYLRYEAVLRQRWGMDRFLLSSVYVRDEYVPDAAGKKTMAVSGIMILGDALAIGMVIVCMIGVRAVHSLREHMMELHSHWVWQQGAAFLIAVQILVLDMVWRVVSQWLVDLENHRTPAQWNRAWVQKVFLVRFFNNLYPFLYIGFIKQFSYQGCPDTSSGCLDELQRYLFTYFVTRLMVHLASDMFLVFVARSQIVRETRANPDGERINMHLQIQAKSQEYDAVMRVDDWTENVLTFLFLTCFNVVLPVISVLALLTTMLEARCLAHRNCCFLRRPVPRGADGIGEWQQLLETVEFLAVLINVGFAVFTMRPMKDLPVAHKVVIFVFIEHVILFVKHLIKEKKHPVPPEVEDIAQQNEEIVRQVAAHYDLHKPVQPALTTTMSSSSIDISPSAFGGRRATRISSLPPQGFTG